MRLSLSIATRFLLSNKVQTIVIILGIGVGVAVQIFIGSLIQGLQTSLIDKTIGNSSQITVTAKKDNEFIKYSNSSKNIVSKVKKSSSKLINVSPTLNAPALIESQDTKNNTTQSVLIRGFELDKAEKIYKIKSQLIEGKMPNKKNDFAVGKGIKEKFKLKIGDKFNLITADRRTIEGRVVGVFDLKVAQINENWCVSTLNTAEEVAVVKGKISAIEMQVIKADVFSADTIAAQLASKLDKNKYKVSNWKGENQQLLSGLQGQSSSSLLIQVFVMLSVVLGIASVLAITVMQKSRQIGILKAMGIKNSTSSLIFLTEGAILGIFGAIAGVTFGLSLAYSFAKFALNADGTPVVPLSIDPKFIALSAVIAFTACVLASLIPARKSSKLDPIDIIRDN
ncbi:MAG: ABC transporter permease [Anaerovoracaceae bacterium]